ncbi:MAG: NADH-quinone oxidoreductase subunit N [Bacteroidota bacterium]|nr:NADH-quinone oxidoreductase subunit N [Bacteroidota bacterium]
MNAILLSVILGVVMMFSSIFVQNKKAFRYIATAGLFILLAGCFADFNGIILWNIDTKGVLVFDNFGSYFNIIAVAVTLVYVLLTGKEIQQTGSYIAEYFALIFFVMCGIFLLSSYNNLLMLFLGIEILSIPLYILTGSDKRNMKSNEASLKYFLMGTFSTGLLLMGIAFIYGATGSFSLEVLHTQPPVANVQASESTVSFLEIVGMLFLMVAIGFKVSAAPFHFWTPDVYDGAPTVFTSFMATIVKAAGFIAFIKLFDARMMETSVENNKVIGVDWKLLFAILIVCTLLVGNITAVFQQSVKRMLAYSSIAQAGFMLFALFSMNDAAKEGILMYTIAYSLATIGIFAILVKLKDFTYEGFNGLGKTQPALAFANTVFLLSLAGIPLTAGFFAKFFMLESVVKTGSYLWLVIVAVVFAAISAYYYFRVIQAMYFKTGDGETIEAPAVGFKIGIVILALAIIYLGIFPQTLFGLFYF